MNDSVATSREPLLTPHAVPSRPHQLGSTLIDTSSGLLDLPRYVSHFLIWGQFFLIC